jgi:hypothetical protein
LICLKEEHGTMVSWTSLVFFILSN